MKAMITVIGDTVLDLVSGNLNKLPKIDTEIRTSFKAKLGGQAAHCALGLAKLNVQNEFITCLGDDYIGKDLVEFFKKEKNINLISQKSGKTAISVIIPTGTKRTIINDSGANTELKKIKNVVGKYLFIGGIWSLENLNILKILKEAKKKNSITFMDMGFNENFSQKKVFEIIKYVDYFFLNEEELTHYAKEKNFQKALKKFPKETALCLHLGPKGSAFYYRNKLVKTKITKKYGKETTGAGDFWNSGFIYGTIKEWPIKDRLDFANKFTVDCLTKQIHNL